jgi:RNA polymerase sigma factor (sigma-70 family)
VQLVRELGLNPAEAGSLTERHGASVAASLEAVFQRHYVRVVSVLARLTGDRGYAEEIAADVFRKLSERPELLGRQDVAPWIYRAATNAGLNALRSNSRRRKREQSVDAHDATRASAPDGALDAMLRQERSARVRVILEKLKPRDAELLLLRAEGLAYRELAETLGIQAGSVGTLLARANAEFERRYRARYKDNV